MENVHVFEENDVSASERKRPRCAPAQTHADDSDDDEEQRAWMMRTVILQWNESQPHFRVTYTPLQCRADWMEKYLQELDRSGDLDAKEDRAWVGAMTTIIAKERTLLTAPHQRKMDKEMRLDPSFAARCSEFLARSLRPDRDDVLVAARVPAAVADLFFVVRLCAHIVKGTPAIQIVSACIREAVHETLNKHTYTLPLELAAFRASRAVSLFGPCSSLESLEDGPWPAASRIMRGHSPRDVYNAFIAFSYETWKAFHMCARTMTDQELHCIFDHARRGIFCATT